MLPPRWRKVLGDIAASPFRTVLAVAAMAAGSFGLGAILTAYSILTHELAATYSDTRPASAILLLDSLDDRIVASVRALPGVADAEARPVIRGRIRVGPVENAEWAPLVLFVVRDFDDQRIDRIGRDSGAWPPADGAVLLERSGLSVARAGVDDDVTVSIPEGRERSLHVAGTVHAPGLPPGWMDHVVTGFVSWRSVMRVDAPNEAAALRIVVDGNRLDEAHIREVAGMVRETLEESGHAVQRVDVPAPGRHPHADQMDTFLFLLGAFGALTLALSAVLVANIIHALLTEQVRQVGMMKAIGASTRQVVALYLGQVAILAALSLCLGIPFGLSAGRAYAAFAGSILNAKITDMSVPAWVFAVEIAVGLMVPLLVSLGPAYRASRITIHEAFSDDAGRGRFGTRRFDLWLARVAWLPRPLMLSLRTTFHRRGRLLLTVGTLAAGGATFISALNVSAAWDSTLAKDAASQRYDIDVRLTRPTPVERLVATFGALPEVAHAEYWADTSAWLVATDGSPEFRVSLVGPDRNTTTFSPRLLRGRWLAPDDAAAVVVNQGLLARNPHLHLGGDIALRVNDRDIRWPIVGVVEELNPTPTAYAPSGDVLAAMSQSGDVTRAVRVVTRSEDPAGVLSAQSAIERALRGAGIGVLDIHRLDDRRQAFADHLVIIKSALILASMLVILVGGLGLMSTLTLNVVERTRELGVLSAIGATPRTISRHVVFEAILIGAMSWCVALVAAVPVTAGLDEVAGRMFHKVGLDFVMSPVAAMGWLGGVLVLAAVSSFYPAWRAGRLTVREALAHA